METEKIYSFYVLTSDLNPDEIRYVGVTTQPLSRRFTLHKYCATHEEKRGLSVHKWMYSVYKNGGKINITKIDECSESEWEEKEQTLIEKYKQLGCKLMNLDKGGKGIITKEKRSKSSIERSVEKHKKAVTAFNLDGSKFMDFNSITEAADYLGGKANNIGMALQGNSKSALGYFWKYKTEESFITPYEREKIGIKIYQFDLEGNLLNIFDSKKDALKYLNKVKSHHALDKALKNKTEYKRYFWSYNNSIDNFISPYKYIVKQDGEEDRKFIEQKEVANYLNLNKSTVNSWLKKYNGTFTYMNYIVETI